MQGIRYPDTDRVTSMVISSFYILQEEKVVQSPNEIEEFRKSYFAKLDEHLAASYNYKPEVQ